MMQKITSLSVLLMLVFAAGLHAQQLEKVYVLNQGAFLQANASVTSWNPATGQVQQNVFQQVNGRPLGDVAVHSALINGLLYILVSNSDTIEIVNPETFASMKRIFVDDFGGSSPQWIEQVSDTKAYVSNLTGTTVSVLDLVTNEITGSIEVGPNPEGIAVSGGKAYVALTDFGNGQQVAVIDIATDTRTALIDVHDNPRFLHTGSDGRVWLMSTGSFGIPESDGKISIIDPATDTVTATVDVPGKPQRIQLNEADNILYVLNNGIMKLDMETLTFADDKLRDFAHFGMRFWNGDQPRIFATTAPDFSSAGSVTVLSTDGDVLTSFTAGIGPDFVQFVSGGPVSVGGDEIASGFRLHQNYPNPFNPATVISYELPEAAEVRLEVFNLMGQRVAVLDAGFRTAGAHQLRFDAGTLASGIYLYRLQAGSLSATRRMTLVR
ncbi:Por secretion system C-terminal sorting domain-containing protein [Cyclonatronum proteinivorum]|uniref:Por secretion system C-terminal sorting domain-containing protein n=1 Tax=Cyclonatronum proteinivorum TaxID=1457365 RepID=A0A345UNB0_9BACT|nr:DUF5074 domain-containing protein [Cyclonatronum proteinivorum]AXJ01962.1 Por secretion system C-terminal sorting domain-containing protein [Cyclonatronum proteinivorum]